MTLPGWRALADAPGYWRCRARRATMLIADGFGLHIPRGYIYAAMAFSAIVEGLNMVARRARQRR